ncbi:hypothetical protein L1987_49157 [Smallanthus sonchifolius]|uniref:Uncharacterized protein n=1 Tax=Smallanthus sonchifolius TaxID=185202 RepID=A0ACB9FUJ7_9ASTR|nr:hypothetical protein L1987_49157 [Smallanthus sonchifolius]
MEIKIQSTHFIKPSKPTPDSLSLSGLDQLAPYAYIHMVFYYKTSGEVDRCGQLVKSLSEVLNLYYPLAGRVTLDGLEVDCGNQGVKYLETKVSTTLDDFLNHGPKIEQVRQLIGAPDQSTSIAIPDEDVMIQMSKVGQFNG